VAKISADRAMAHAVADRTAVVASMPGLPALADITSLSVSEIQPTALVIPQLTVVPLAPTAPLVVAPIGEIDRH
jgi:hypothetical protein